VETVENRWVHRKSADPILRIVLLTVVAVNEPGWMKIAHDTALRGMFYIVIFALWVIWEERFRRREEEG